MMEAKKLQFALWASLLGVLLGFSQEKRSKGDELFFQYEYQRAVEAYEVDLAKGRLSLQQYLNLADSYFMIDDHQKASEAYLNIFKRDTLMDGMRYNRMLRSLSRTGDPERKQSLLETLSATFPKALLENMEFNAQMLEKAADGNDLDYKIFNLDGNSPQTDFAPGFFGDQLLFSSGRIQGRGLRYAPGNEGYFNIYGAPLKPDGQIGPIRDFNKLQDTDYHRATPYYSQNLNSVFYVLSNTQDGELAFDPLGKNALAIGKQTLDGPMELLLKDLSTSFYYPFYDQDSGKLYFAADFKDGYGGTDLYFVYTNNGHVMSAPINLGPRINSPGNEIAPFIFENSFYFASDVFFGLGGMDIYKSNMGADGEFGIPINLGTGINSSWDDFGLVIRNQGEGLLGYFASNRPGGKGKDDLYGFIVAEKPGLKTAIFKGKVVKSHQQGFGVPEAAVRLLDAQGNLLAETLTDGQGDYRLEIPWEEHLAMEVSKERYSEFRKEFSQEEIETLEKDSFSVGISLYDDLVEEREGQVVVKMGKFLFGRTSTQLTPEIEGELDRVVAFVKAFPWAQLRIETYTDSRGGSTTNYRLTQARSDAIKAYLLGQGVSTANILYSIGYGEDKILNNCTNGVFCIELLHQQNQRSLVVVLNDNVFFD